MEINNPVLPINTANGFVLSKKSASEVGQALMGDYAFAEPFPHIVLDNFLPSEMANALLENFPNEAKSNDKVYEKGYGGLFKRQIFPYDCEPYVQAAFSFFNSAPMLKFLEDLTNIKGLLPDPYFTGGGLHETSAGGLLGIHADFRVNEKLQLLRRVNLLIYLNKDWKDDYAGKLELWDKEMTYKVKEVSPVFNRCVIFNTDEDSFHGHPEPLTAPDGVTRKSIALYYYTATPIKNDSGESRHTLYVARPQDSARVKANVKKMAKKREKRAKKLFGDSKKKSLQQFLNDFKAKFFS